MCIVPKTVPGIVESQGWGAQMSRHWSYRWGVWKVSGDIEVSSWENVQAFNRRTQWRTAFQVPEAAQAMAQGEEGLWLLWGMMVMAPIYWALTLYCANNKTCYSVHALFHPHSLVEYLTRVFSFFFVVINKHNKISTLTIFKYTVKW